MKPDKIKQQVENIEITWDCISRENRHEIGCPHKEWTIEDLHGALVAKKKFEQSGLAGEILT